MPLEFFADEGVDNPLVIMLRQNGFSVKYAAEECIAFTDMDLLAIAKEKGCIFITKDKDFGELIIRNKMSIPGIILVRLEKLNRQENCLLVTEALKKFSAELLGSFTVIQKDKIRIRKL